MNLADYWYTKLDIDFNRLKKFWESKHKKRLAKELKKRSSDSLKRICDLFSIQYEMRDTKNSIIKKIVEFEKAIEILCCIDYYEQHIKTIEEILQNKEIQEIFTGSDINDPLLALIKIYKIKPDFIVQINIIHKWRRLDTNNEYVCYRPLTVQEVNKLKSKIRSISLYLRKKDKNKFSYRILQPYCYDDDYYFLIQRQTNYRSEKNYDRSKIRKPMAELLYRFNLNDRKIECRYSKKYRDNENITKRFINRIKKYADRWFEEQQKDVRDRNVLSDIHNKLILSKEQLEQQKQKKFEIVGISFSTVNLPGAVGLDIPKSESDIRPALYQLREDGILKDELLKENINNILVRWDNRKPRKIIFNKKKHLFLILEPDFRYLSPKERNSFQDQFTASFIPLNQLIDISNNPTEELYLIKSLLQSQNLKSPHSIKIKKTNELSDAGLINFKERKIKLCTNCGHKKLLSANTEYSSCAECKSTRLVSPPWSKEINIKQNKEGIGDFLSKIVSKEGISLSNKNSQRTFLKKYSFIEFSFNSENVYIFLEEEKITAKQLSYFIKSGMPILIVSLNNDASKDLVREHSFISYENLASIYLRHKKNNLPEDFFKNQFKMLLLNSEEKIIARADNSSKNIKKWLIDKTNQTNRDEFETDTYNLLAYLLINSERWGQKLIGDKELPDGIGGIVYKGSKYTYKTSIAWDCKYTQTKADLNISEKRKASSYLKKLRKPAMIHSYGKKVNSFLIITHSPKKIQFKNFTNYVKKETDWKGVMVLLHPLVIY
ncbi:MAG: hypothetical protein GF329_02810, partial [Candidatus Lokiarchaeota archaeon]|nr:hypothetical protein [Candidatus Lokiarchaeota archaeon]